MSTKGLGRGLSALLSDNVITKQNDYTEKLIAIEKITANSDQPRKYFDAVALNELAQSICTNGIIQPIVVYQQADNDKYTIIAGERRFRASKIAGLKEVPVIIKKITDEKQILELAIVENIQRKDLSAIEEAESYKKLMLEYNYRQEDLSKILGKSRSHIANILRLNNLPDFAKNKINEGLISLGHAKVLLGLQNDDNIDKIVLQIISNNLSVRQTEKLLKQNSSEQKQNTKKAELTTIAVSQDDIDKSSNLDERKDSTDVTFIERILEKHLKLKVSIKELEKNDEGNGNITIFFNNYLDLDLLIKKLIA